MNRWKDWWDQGERDVRHAGHAFEDADYEWSAFAAQQGAEKASSFSRPRSSRGYTSEGNPLLREALEDGRDLL